MKQTYALRIHYLCFPFLVVKLNKDVLDFVTPFEHVALPISKSLVQIDELGDSVFSNVVRECLCFLPRQRTALSQ